MTTKDKLFKIYQQGEQTANPDDMAYILWSENAVYNFSQYSYAYRQAAEALYNQFVQSRGEYAMKDPMGITLAFMYRHYMELTSKYLYLKFKPYIIGKELNEEEIAEFVGHTGHNLNVIWQELRPVLTELRKRLRTSFDVDAFGHYVSEFQRYDDSSMRMRYPVDKDGKAIEKESKRLDIRILHDYMDDCMNEVDKLVAQWDDQIYWEEEDKFGNLFMDIYNDARVDIEQFLKHQAAYAEAYRKTHENDGLVWKSLSDISTERQPEYTAVSEFLKSLSDNHLLLIHNLYYVGKTSLGRIKVWKKIADRQEQFKKSATIISRSEVSKFNAEIDRGELIDTLTSKLPQTVYDAVKGCVEMVDEDFC